MTLLERAEGLTGKAEHIKKLSASRGEQETLQVRVNELTNAVDRLASSATFAHLANTRSIASPNSKIAISVQRTMQRARSLEATASKDPTVDDKPIGDLGRTVDALTEQLERWAKESWTSHTAQTMPAPQPEIVDPLRGNPAYEDVIAELDTTRQFLNVLAARPWPTSEELEQYERHVETWRDLLANLPSSHDPEIVEFLRAAGTVGAPLDRLSPKVQEWLIAHRLLSSYVIRRG